MKKRIIIILVIVLIFAATIAIGAYLLKSKSNPASPVANQGKTGGNFEIGKETVPKAVDQNKGGTNVAAKSTKEIFASIPKNIKGRLIRVMFRRMFLGENKSLTSVLIFVHYNDTTKKTTETGYVFASGDFVFLKNIKMEPISSNPETVPEPVIDLGYDGMRKILLASSDYVDYRTKYPELVKNCSSSLLKNVQYGWEWITTCTASINNKKASVAFSMNFDTKKVTVIRSENLE